MALEFGVWLRARVGILRLQFRLSTVEASLPPRGQSFRIFGLMLSFSWRRALSACSRVRAGHCPGRKTWAGDRTVFHSKNMRSASVKSEKTPLGNGS